MPMTKESQIILITVVEIESFLPTLSLIRKKVEIVSSRSEWWERGNVSYIMVKDSQQLTRKS